MRDRATSQRRLTGSVVTKPDGAMEKKKTKGGKDEPIRNII